MAQKESSYFIFDTKKLLRIGLLIKEFPFYVCRNLHNYNLYSNCQKKLKMTSLSLINKCTSKVDLTHTQTLLLIPQGMVDNNLGPNRLAGPKVLDPNYCRQSTLSLHDFGLCLEVLTVHGTGLSLFGA